MTLWHAMNDKGELTKYATGPLVIAVDFDGTIVEHAYPDIGEPVPGAFMTLMRWQEQNHRLILWTMRSGTYLHDAIRFCKENGLEFWGHNENPEQTETSWSDSPKQYAQVYIDDAAFGCPLRPGLTVPTRPMVDWSRIKLS